MDDPEFEVEASSLGQVSQPSRSAPWEDELVSASFVGGNNKAVAWGETSSAILKLAC